MNRDETAKLLKARSALTSQPYGDDTIDAWHDVLTERTFVECRTALLDASKTDKRIAVAHVIEHLPTIARTSTAPPDYCELCDGCGTVSVPPERAHNPRVCRPTPEHPCICHAVEPCRCTAGQGMGDVLRRIVEYNDHHRARQP